MATPSKSVQFRDTESVVRMYDNMKVPAFGIKQNGALNFKYQGDDLDEGTAQLRAYLDMLTENESAAIYTLAVYEEPAGRITEKTPVDLSWNFRLRDQVSGIPGEMYSGVYGQLIGQVKELKKQIEDMKTVQPEEHRLGIIGEVMEMESFQPILMAIGTKIADWVTGVGMGELKRVSGVPGVSSDRGELIEWRGHPDVDRSLDRMNRQIDDLPAMLVKLADLAEKNPKQFKFYQAMLYRMKL